DLTAELYDLIALALRAFVIPWWSKISRYDKHFLPDITRILAAVVRALDARVQSPDIPLLFFHHVPVIVAQHYADYRSAHAKLATSYASGGAASLPQLFHQLQPHMALSPDGRVDTEYFRQVVDHILKASLPDEDYQPDSERFIIRELIVKLVLVDIIPKITQPWFIQRSIHDLLDLHQPPLSPSSSSTSPPTPFSFQTLVVLVLSAIQTVSGACLALIQAYKQAVSTIRRVNKFHPNLHIHPMTSPTSSSSTTTSSSSLPPAPPQGNYVSPPLSMVAEIFSLHDRFASMLLLTATQMLSALSASFLDRLLPHLLRSFFSPAFLLNITRISKRTLFPNGYPGPPPIEPTPEEQAEVRARLVAWRPSGTLGHALDPLSSPQCNVHLALLLLDCILGTLFPELLG
ncbi:PXA domain-containing protein, partial [Collybia nuda]